MFTNRPAQNAPRNPVMPTAPAQAEAMRSIDSGAVTADAYHIRERVQRKLISEADGDVSVIHGPQMQQMIEMFFEAADAERQGTQFDNHIGRLGGRHVAQNFVPSRPAGLGVETEYLAAAAADQPLHAGRKGIGHRDTDVVDRLKQNRIALGHAFAHRQARRLLE